MSGVCNLYSLIFSHLGGDGLTLWKDRIPNSEQMIETSLKIFQNIKHECCFFFLSQSKVAKKRTIVFLLLLGQRWQTIICFSDVKVLDLFVGKIKVGEYLSFDQTK